jgi:hypothetical protein
VKDFSTIFRFSSFNGLKLLEFQFLDGFKKLFLLQGNPIHALGQSISFGRFMSESLAWEKWSSFSHNRYVEEAERYARPGSVAQKKAFFEAHYKKIAAQKAAALLEQENAAANSAPKPAEEEDLGHNTHEVVDQQPEVKAYSTVHDNGYSSNAGVDKFESGTVDGADLVPENQVLVENPLAVEQPSHLRDVDNQGVNEMELCGTPQMKKPLLKVRLATRVAVSGSCQVDSQLNLNSTHLECDFVGKKCDLKRKRKKCVSFERAFLKNYGLKT